MQTDGIKIDKHFLKNLGQYFMDGYGSDGTVVKGLIAMIPSFFPWDYAKCKEIDLKMMCWMSLQPMIAVLWLILPHQKAKNESYRDTSIRLWLRVPVIYALDCAMSFVDRITFVMWIWM